MIDLLKTQMNDFTPGATLTGRLTGETSFHRCEADVSRFGRDMTQTVIRFRHVLCN